MANNSIGGFFVSLGIKQDASFKAGEDALKKFIGTATKVAALASVKLAGSLENTNLKLAKSIGISVQDLKAWQDAASKAGISGSALTSSMANLETKMQKLKLGEIDQGLAKNLGMLGIGYDQFAGMNANERINSVFKAAGAMQDQAKAAVLVGDILGSAGREYYDWLALSGSTLSKELSEAKALNFTTEESAKGAAAFNAEFNAIVSSTKSIGLLISSKIGEALTPVAKKVKEILAANKEFIASGIIGVVDVLGKIGRGMGDVLMNLTGADSIGEALGKIVDGVRKIAGPAIEQSIELLKDLASAMHALLSGDWKALGDSLYKFFEDYAAGLRKLIFGQTVEETAHDIGNGQAGVGKKIIASVESAFTSDKEKAAAIDHGFADEKSRRKHKAMASQILARQIYETDPAYKDLRDKYSFSEIGTWSLSDVNPENWSNASKLMFNEFLNLWGDKNGYGSKLQAMGTGSVMGNWYDLNPLQYSMGKTRGRPVKDGIISPKGDTVQVAPDDWVFAARNLGDMASAFIPQSVMSNATTSNASYTITQEFTFNGTSRDMAGEVMRQAYRGTQSGLMAAMNKSTQRVQLMPGLR